MNYLFIHQNFPGQFRHVAKALVERGHRVLGLGDVVNLKDRPAFHPAVSVFGYQARGLGQERSHHYIRDFEGAIRRGQSVVRAALRLREKGFIPDVVVVHPGWGEGLFLRDIFPQARQVHYCEYYYTSTGGDVGFDPEFPVGLDDHLRIRVKNATQLVGLVAMDQGIAPTRWQAGRYPAEFQSKIRVIHEGIDTDIVRPNPDAVFDHSGLRFTRCDEVVTYVARNLEPYRGFHVFMKCLPSLLASRPKAHVLIVGGDEVSYGKRLPEGKTYREIYCAELKNGIDWNRVHFVGKLPYADYLKALQISSAHVYLTYPFVLSWSMLEAMSAGCAIVASATTPVEEVIENGKQGLLVDFFDPAAIARTVGELLENREQRESLGLAARNSVIERFDLKRHCLPEMLAFLEK